MKNVTLASGAFLAVIVGVSILPASAADSVLVDDQSLSLAQYKTVGFPDATRVWSVDDLKLAAKAILQLSKQDPSYMPRAASLKSGPLFARLVSPDPLNAIKKLPDQTQRLVNLTAAVQCLSTISKPYLAPPQGKYFDAETTLLSACAARYTAATMHEFVTLRTPGDDPQFEKTMDGLAKQLDDAVSLLRTGTTVSLPSRVQLLKDLDPVLHDVMPLLPLSAQTPLVKAMQDDIDAETDSEFTKQERVLLEWLQRNVKK